MAAVLNCLTTTITSGEEVSFFVAAVFNCLLITIANGDAVSFFVAAVLNMFAHHNSKWRGG